MNMQQFLKNRSRFPPVDLEQYAGKYVAWSPDGKTIIAASEDPLHVVAEIRAAGFDPEDCVLSSVPTPEEVVLGGGLDG